MHRACAIVLLVTASAAAEPKPVVVMYEVSAWTQALATETPRFALYDDGLVIYQRTDGPVSVTLSPTEKQQLLKSLALGGLAKLKPKYDLTKATDQGKTVLQMWANGKKRSVEVRGRIRKLWKIEVRVHDEPGRRFAEGERPNPLRKKAPKAFLKTYDAIAAFDHAGATPWMPELVEVMLSPASASEDGEDSAGTAWPKDWPGLADPRSRQRGSSWSVYLPAAKLAALQTLAEGDPVLLDGKAWDVAYRLPLPHEMPK